MINRWTGQTCKLAGQPLVQKEDIMKRKGKTYVHTCRRCGKEFEAGIQYETRRPPRFCPSCLTAAGEQALQKLREILKELQIIYVRWITPATPEDLACKVSITINGFYGG